MIVAQAVVALSTTWLLLIVQPWRMRLGKWVKFILPVIILAAIIAVVAWVVSSKVSPV